MEKTRFDYYTELTILAFGRCTPELRDIAKKSVYYAGYSGVIYVQGI